MDRDKRWGTVKIAYDLLVHGVGKKATDMVEAMQESVQRGHHRRIHQNPSSTLMSTAPSGRVTQ